MKKAAMGKRSFPGRLTLEQWQAVPFRKRIDLIWRAQCDLLGSFRCCVAKRCRRHRTCCCKNPNECSQKLWRLKKVRPKTLRQEWARLGRLKEL
jgi:hypothetical protein